MFHTFTNLQGSQTKEITVDETGKFHTFTNLQGSQTNARRHIRAGKFHTFTNLQGSQTLNVALNGTISFTPLQTYKVLKPARLITSLIHVSHLYKLTRFSNKSTWNPMTLSVSHLYKLTRFSNYESGMVEGDGVSHLYKLTRFSNKLCSSVW